MSQTLFFHRSVAEGLSMRSRILLAALLAHTAACTANQARIWAAALNGASDGLSGRTRSQPTAAPGPPFNSNAPSTCMSDYQCPIGQACLKQHYRSDGICVRKVNSYGVQSYTPPGPASVSPNLPSNHFDCSISGFVCPAAFRCDYNTGACIR